MSMLRCSPWRAPPKPKALPPPQPKARLLKFAPSLLLTHLQEPNLLKLKRGLAQGWRSFGTATWLSLTRKMPTKKIRRGAERAQQFPTLMPQGCHHLISKEMADPKVQSNGSGFVAFSTKEEANRAVNEMNGKMIGRKPLHVTVAQY